tara:strand:+ start:1641 stop:1811 length:171 start_codon:yes stop_codon:yes gene_type:complete
LNKEKVFNWLGLPVQIGNRLQVTNETTISLIDYSKEIFILKAAYGDKVKEVKVIKD